MGKSKAWRGRCIAGNAQKFGSRAQTSCGSYRWQPLNITPKATQEDHPTVILIQPAKNLAPPHQRNWRSSSAPPPPNEQDCIFYMMIECPSNLLYPISICWSPSPQYIMTDHQLSRGTAAHRPGVQNGRYGVIWSKPETLSFTDCPLPVHTLLNVAVLASHVI